MRIATKENEGTSNLSGMLSRDRLEEMQMESAADDIEIEDAMEHWGEADVLAFFESGGAVRPSPLVSGVFALEAQVPSLLQLSCNWLLGLRRLGRVEGGGAVIEVEGVCCRRI